MARRLMFYHQVQIQKPFTNTIFPSLSGFLRSPSTPRPWRAGPGTTTARDRTCSGCRARTGSLPPWVRSVSPWRLDSGCRSTGSGSTSFAGLAEVSFLVFLFNFCCSSSKRALGEETFQREIISGFIDARVPENLLWNIERIITNIFIPILNSSAIGGANVTEDLKKKVRNELLPCLRSFTR